DHAGLRCAHGWRMPPMPLPWRAPQQHLHRTMSQTSASAASIPLPMIAFIGGGNMASAIIGGLIRQGHPAHQIEVVEPWEEARVALQKNFDIQAQATAGPALARAGIVVWAVKPQTFKDAAAQAREHTQHA